MKRTPLWEEHKSLGATLLPFAGYSMPVSYPTGVIAEHHSVRRSAGLFDVSHMGEVRIHGRGATAYLQHVTLSDPGALAVGESLYTALATPSGGIVDDLLVYRTGTDSYLLVVNAACRDQDIAHLRDQLPSSGVVLEDASEEYGLLALQGPASRELLSRVADVKMDQLPPRRFTEGKVFGVPALLARTGYTGELGYELYCPPEFLRTLWQGLLLAGAPLSVTPAGLGARDTLRLEMAYLLSGQDMHRGVSAIESGLGRTISWTKGAFVGRNALLAEHDRGPGRKLVPFVVADGSGRIPRTGYSIHSEDGNPIGQVTSGNHSPTLGKGIGLALLSSHWTPGTPIWADVRGILVQAQVARRPLVPLKGDTA